jgi:PhnB protein
MDKAYGISRREWMAAGVCAGTLATWCDGGSAGAKMQKLKGEDMANLTPYLLFEGNCQQAMEFYEGCFGGDLRIMKVKDSPAKEWMAAAQQDKVINAQLRSERIDISASDWLRPDRTPVRGNTVCLYLSGGTLAELKALFEKLSQGAEVTDPLKEMFFGSYGALNDRFGVRWMFQTNEKA